MITGEIVEYGVGTTSDGVGFTRGNCWWYPETGGGHWVPIQTYYPLYPYTLCGEESKVAKETSETGITLTFTVPGFGKEDLELETEKTEFGTSITATGEDLEISYTVIEKINTENIEASCEKGILTVFLPYQEKMKSKVEIS